MSKTPASKPASPTPKGPAPKGQKPNNGDVSRRRWKAKGGADAIKRKKLVLIGLSACASAILALLWLTVE